MLTAQIGHDLNAFSKGRFVLGLGSQIRPHITRRFSMPWSHPAARMREFIQAMRAIWDCWYHGAPLDFRGEFYSHTLMTPMFTPTNTQHGAPRVFLAAVGPRMTEVAGEVADGLIAHAFTTERYLRDVTLPAVLSGLAAGGRRRESFEITCPVFVVTGADGAAFEASRDATRKQIAFYGSTPAYRGVLEAHGWGALQDELTRLSKRGRWDEMGGLIDDDMLGTFAVVAEPDEVVPRLRARCEGAVDRVLCTFALGSGAQERARIAALRA
jgi:probable F420-dependent oxidoreductase